MLGTSEISMRRFFERLAVSPFDATGSNSPYPAALSTAGFTPLLREELHHHDRASGRELPVRGELPLVLEGQVVRVPGDLKEPRLDRTKRLPDLGERLSSLGLEVGLAFVEQHVVVERKDDATAPHPDTHLAGVDHLLELGDELVEEGRPGLRRGLLLAQVIELRRQLRGPIRRDGLSRARREILLELSELRLVGVELLLLVARGRLRVVRVLQRRVVLPLRNAPSDRDGHARRRPSRTGGFARERAYHRARANGHVATEPRCDTIGPMVRFLTPSLCAFVFAACASTPALQSPLREKLAASDTPAVEQAARTCLVNSGWKVDPVGGVSGGANVVTAFKAKEQTDVYIYPAETKPRITGGPDYRDGFWKCLGSELGSGSSSGEKAGSDDSPKAGDKP